MVLPPRAKRRSLRSSCTDFSMASQSTPWWPKNFWSSDESTACTRCRDMRETGTQLWMRREERPAARASASRWRMIPVVPGLLPASACTSPRPGKPIQT